MFDPLAEDDDVTDQEGEQIVQVPTGMVFDHIDESDTDAE